MKTLGSSQRVPAATRCHWGSAQRTEPLPRGFLFGLLLMSCPGQRWHLCFVLFAMPCLAPGSLTCSHGWNGFISPFRSQIWFAEIVLTQDHAVM